MYYLPSCVLNLLITFGSLRGLIAFKITTTVVTGSIVKSVNNLFGRFAMASLAAPFYRSHLVMEKHQKVKFKY